jgi:hypothetical protein
MTGSQIYLAVIKIYEEFYRQATLRQYFEFKHHPMERKQIISFTKWFKKEYKEQKSIEVLIQYFEFQFSHYAGIQTKYGKNSIILSWLIGVKARKRWIDRDKTKHWLVKFRLKDVDMKLHKAFKDERLLEKIIKNQKIFSQLNSYEEKEKQRFYNTLKGFIYCMTTTTLFNPLSQFCNGCTNQNVCKTTLENHLPKIYKLRCQKKVNN